MTKIDVVFLKFGQAMHFIQLIETNLATFYLIDAIRAGKVIVREDLEKLERDWDDETFGGLIRPIKVSPHILDDIKNYFEDIRVSRNYLAHRFFKKHADVFFTESGQDAMSL